MKTSKPATSLPHAPRAGSKVEPGAAMAHGVKYFQANEPVTVIEDAEVKLQVREVVQRSVKWAVKLSNKVLYVKVLGEHRSVRAYRNVPDMDTLDGQLFCSTEIPDFADCVWYQWGNDGKRVMLSRTRGHSMKD